MSSMSRFALKEFKLNTCDAYYRQSYSLSSRRLRTHLGMFDFYAFTFWVSVFCAFWQLGSVNLVPWQLKFTDFSVPILRGLWQFLVSLCFKHFICFFLSKIEWFSDVRGEISVPDSGRSCAIQSKPWSPILAAPSSIVQTSRCVLWVLFFFFSQFAISYVFDKWAYMSMSIWSSTSISG